MKGFEYTFPAVDLSFIDNEDILKFAKRHGVTEEQLTPYHLDDDWDKARLFYNVVRKETELSFKLGTTSEGCCMIWIPNLFGDISYSEMFDIMYPYLREIGEYNFQHFDAEVCEFED